MARINIEECWWSDPRRIKLGQLLGNPYFTETVAVHAWRLSQEHWERGFLIPGHIYVTMFGALELLTANLASLHENREPGSTIIRTPVEHIGTQSSTSDHRLNTLRTHMNTIEDAHIYVRGSCEYLSWGMDFRQKKVDAGRKSAIKRLELYGTSQPISNTSRTKPNTSELSGSGSGSGSGSSSNSGSGSKKTNAGIRIEYPGAFNELWIAYGIKGDKKRAFTEWGKLGLTPAEHNDLVRAITNYHAETPDPQYRKDFERFLVMDWREKVNPKTPKPPAGGNGIYPPKHKNQVIAEQNDQLIARLLAEGGRGEPS